ncbi:hypothetical protein ACKUB1_09755 [Methanospirillum stamsii]|uniref:Uncharacterized protein n=1 Tax=Methanospirillum stamsii TaxID=1277351 RepID=A0A2V2N9T6_9EURY|nr:hypothetical protein [Methanospirillum stamsii]PWR75345.1 hypothetical protein DLD82_04210 [Methanospirillum stamsii]
MKYADESIKRRICPFISSGQFIVYCRGVHCNAARPVRLDDGETIWVCILIEGMRPIFPVEEGDVID